MEIEITRRAKRQMDAIPQADRQRIQARIKAYATNPGGREHDVVALANPPPGFRLRAGDWRVLFDRIGQRMIVQRVLHRREAYR